MLANPRSERAKRVAALSGRSARSRTGLILVEGPQAVRELLAHRGETVRDVYFTEAAAQRYGQLWEAARRVTRYVHLVSQAVADAMSGDAQGIIAVADAAAVAARLERWEGARLVVVLAEAQDPGNVGTIIRLADACGAQAVVIAKGGADATSPKVIRSSVGSVFHLPIVRGVEFGAAVAELRGAGMQVLAAHGYGEVSLEELLVASLNGGAKTSTAAEQAGGQAAQPDLGGATKGPAKGPAKGPELGGPTAWVFGNEARGLSEAELAACDASVRIALRGHAESFNVAGAAAILLHASSLAQARG